METITMAALRLRYDLQGTGKVVRYKDYVVAAIRTRKRKKIKYKTCVYRPIRPDANIDFEQLPLEYIDERDHRVYSALRDTEGEALLAGFYFSDYLR